MQFQTDFTHRASIAWILFVVFVLFLVTASVTCGSKGSCIGYNATELLENLDESVLRAVEAAAAPFLCRRRCDGQITSEEGCEVVCACCAALRLARYSGEPARDLDEFNAFFPVCNGFVPVSPDFCSHLGFDMKPWSVLKK